MFPSGKPTATCIKERQPEARAEHLVSLPGWETKWGLWKWVGLRGAGFAADGVLRLATPEAAEAADEVLAAEEAAEQAWERALDAVNAALDALPPERKGVTDESGKVLVKALRLLKSGALPPIPESALAEAWAIREFHRASAQVGAAHAEFVCCFAADRLKAGEALGAVAEDGRFREAIVWQNRRALQTGINSLREKPATTTTSKYRQHQELAASYLQRYCVKNDSIGFFGPIGWARLSPETDSLSVHPGHTMLASREVYFECWTIDALCQRLSQDAALRLWVPPRQLPAVRLVDRTLHRSLKLPVLLTPTQALVLAACDGATTAREIARQLLACSSEVFDSEDAVYRELAQSEAQNLIVWQVEVGDEARPEQRLRELLEGVEDGEVRSRAMELLEKMEGARAEVAAAAGDAEKLERAMEEMEVMFENETGTSATRKAGQVYAGRTLVYEDCRRDVEVEIGANVLEQMSGVMGLMLESARWLAWAVGQEYRRALHDIYLSLVRERGSTVLDIEPLWLQAEPLLIGSETHLLDKVVESFQQKWSEVFSLSTNARSVQYTSGELRGHVAVTFAAPQTGWSAARYHSPDLMIAAESVEAIRQGDYIFVLGELHVATNTLGSASFVLQHPSPEDLFRSIAVDLPRPRVVPVLPKNAHVPKRLADILNLPGDFLLAYGEGAPGIPATRLLPVSALVVEASGSDLFVRTRDYRERFDIIEFFGSVLSGTIVDNFKLFGPREHTPRVTIDRLVVQRESWSLPAAKLAFAFERLDADRFLEARRFQQQHQMPRHVFCKVPVELKPVYVDFNSAIYVNLLAKLIRRSVAEEGEAARVTVSEMLPGMGEVWLPDREGKQYTSEFRFVALDLRAA